MGSFRGQLIAAAVAFPSASIAEACDKEAPYWNPAYGPVGSFREFVHTVTNPFVVVASLVVLVLIFSPRRIANGVGGVFGALICTILAIEYWGADVTGFRDAAISEGCMGPGWLTVSVYAIACLFAISRAFRAKFKTSSQ